MKYEIYVYQRANGDSPFAQWVNTLRDKVTRNRISKKLLYIKAGNLGDFKGVGDGVQESRLDFGPGYRIYFTIEKGKIILLLLGGDKSTQKKDIARAKVFLKDYKERKNTNG